MLRFSKWFDLEFFMDSMELESIKKQAFAETFVLILRALQGFSSLNESDQPEFNSEVQSELKKIVDSIKIIRNAGIKDRAEKIDFIKKVNEEIEKAKSDENHELELDIDDAIPILIQLGYIKKNQVESMEIDDIEQKILEASLEQGNDVLFEMSEGDLKKARETLANAIFKVFGKKINSVSWDRNQRRLGDRVGHQHYEPEELAREMYLVIDKMAYRRKWAGGRLLDWGDSIKGGSTRLDAMISGKEEINPAEIYAYFSNIVNTSASKIRSSSGRAMDPSSQGKIKSNIHGNRDKKIKVISDDLRKDNIYFYQDYLEKAKKEPLSQRSPEEVLVLPSEKDDDIRLEIMKGIEYEYEYKASTRDSLSLLPEKIRETLKSYIANFLKKGEKRAIHASTLVGDRDSSDDEVMSALGNEVGIDSDDDTDHQGANPIASKSISSQRRGADEMFFDFLKPYIVDAINQISEEGRITPKGNPGANEALALCIKFAVPCTVAKMTKTFKGESKVVPQKVFAKKEETVSPDIESYFREKLKELNASSWDNLCKSALNNYSVGVKDNKQIAAKWSSDYGLSPVYDGSIQEYLFGTRRQGLTNSEGGLFKLCVKLKEIMIRNRILT